MHACHHALEVEVRPPHLEADARSTIQSKMCCSLLMHSIAGSGAPGTEQRSAQLHPHIEVELYTSSIASAHSHSRARTNSQKHNSKVPLGLRRRGEYDLAGWRAPWTLTRNAARRIQYHPLTKHSEFTCHTIPAREPLTVFKQLVRWLANRSNVSATHVNQIRGIH